jgi:hypothetical protein
LEAKKLKLATKGFLFFRKGFLGCNVVSQGEIRTFNKEKKIKIKMKSCLACVACTMCEVPKHFEQ